MLAVMSVAVLLAKALLKVRKDAIGLCEVFQSGMEVFISRFAEEAHKADRL